MLYENKKKKEKHIVEIDKNNTTNKMYLYSKLHFLFPLFHLSSH